MKLMFALFTLCVIFFNSCDEEDNNTKSNSIIGRWKIETKEQFNCTITSRNQFFTDNSTWEFRADQTYSIYSSDGTTVTLDATYEGPSANNINLCYQSSCFPYTISSSGNKLTLTETGSTDCLLRYIFIKV